MFDPAAMGTLLIGLDADRPEAHNDRRRRASAVPRRERAVIRMALAGGLRRAAAILERPIVGEVTN